MKTAIVVAAAAAAVLSLPGPASTAAERPAVAVADLCGTTTLRWGAGPEPVPCRMVRDPLPTAAPAL